MIHTNNIDDYKDRLDAPIGAIRTGGLFMTEEMKANVLETIKDYAAYHKTKYPCVGIICHAQQEGECAETCPISAYCKEGCFTGYKANEAENYARHLLMTGYAYGKEWWD